MKKIPIRQCVGCRQGFPKPELIRVVRTPEGEILLDATGKQAGRGAYLCKNAACLAKARKARSLEKVLGVSIPGEVYDRLEGELS